MRPLAGNSNAPGVSRVYLRRAGALLRLKFTIRLANYVSQTIISSPLSGRLHLLTAAAGELGYPCTRELRQSYRGYGLSEMHG
jgi:hypothetical protein